MLPLQHAPLPQHPALCLGGPQLILGRGAACHVSLVDPKVPLQAARLQVADRHDGLQEVTLQCLSKLDGFTVNDAQLHVNQTVTLHEGDTIRIPGSGDPFDFVFKPCDDTRASLEDKDGKTCVLIFPNDVSSLSHMRRDNKAASGSRAPTPGFSDSNVVFAGPGQRSVQIHPPNGAAATPSSIDDVARTVV